jgi:hypothetical protein
MITLYFTREFIKGTLKGLRQRDTITFVNEQAAAGWLASMTSKKKRQRLNYVIVDKSFQKYWRD